MNRRNEYVPSGEQKIKLQNPMRKYRKWHLLLIVGGAIILCLLFGLSSTGLLLGGVIGWMLGYIVMNGIAGVRLMKMNLTKHSFSSLIERENLFKALEKYLDHPDFKLIDQQDFIQIDFQNKSIHKIWIHENKLTYSLVSRTQKKRIFLDRHNPGIKEYSYAYTVYPIVREIVEDHIEKTLQNDSILSRSHNLL